MEMSWMDFGAVEKVLPFHFTPKFRFAGLLIINYLLKPPS